MPALTVRQLVELPEIRKWRPEVLTGAHGLAAEVRWLHVAEILDIAVMLKGGEIVLTTGALWPTEDEAALGEYVDHLVTAGVSGLFLALGRTHRMAPPAVLRACRRRGLALVVFHRPVPFVELTEGVHARILHERYGEMTFAEEIHAIFSGLTLAEAGLPELLGETARLADCPVVLENLTHRVLASAGGDLAPADLLRDWDRQSRGIPLTHQVTALDGGWVVAPVTARGLTWARLLFCGSALPAERAVLLGEQAAQALALHRMMRQRSGESAANWEQAAVGALLADLLQGRAGAIQDLRLRARSAGFPVVNRIFTPLVLRTGPAPSELSTSGPAVQLQIRRAAELMDAGARAHEVPILVSPVAADTAVAVLSSADPGQARDHVEAVAVAVRERLGLASRQVAIGVGHGCDRLEDLPVSYREAGHVADAALAAPPSRAYARLADVHLRGLVRVLRDDTRLQAFVERELGELLKPRARNVELLEVLRTFLFSHHNKSATASEHHLSRPALYRRLVEIERRLGVDLDDIDRVISLQVALLAWDAQRETAPSSTAATAGRAQANLVTSTETKSSEAAEPE